MLPRHHSTPPTMARPMRLTLAPRLPVAQSYSAAPQIQNPFPVPGAAGPAVTAGPTAAAASSDYDPDMAAQIAQWQSAYLPRDATAAAPNATGPNAVDPAKAAEAANMDPSNKKTVMRQGGGKKWSDDTLLEWDPSHLRLFVGNLAGEVTDESLLKAFSRWTSVQKARVIRDNRTNKSKGYGFVSFSDADDFFQAAKDMNNKYIQSRPVTVRKANTEIKVTNAKDPRKKGKKQGKHDRQDHHSHEPNLGPRHGGGIVKPGQKTKNGLKLLG
ncbi:hypothetical protein Golomagni_05904 [Golovinomyces magnicellulatus]|nr:hypothetical protein Golomagni_05904 [Golovinomyces magnicellulatus]